MKEATRERDCPYNRFDFAKMDEVCTVTGAATHGAPVCDFGFTGCAHYLAQTSRENAPGASAAEGGYYFVLTQYADGRCAYSAKRYASEASAQRRATQLERRADVKAARVCYQTGIAPVDIKQYV